MTSPFMQPLAGLPAGGIQAVLTDLDDTLTMHGKLPARAYAALEALQRAGLRVVIITGRPAGWCDHLARMWPVDAVVGENGAFYFCHTEGRLHKRYFEEAAARAAKRERLASIASRILAAVPGCALASDQHYRECDLAIDYCEDVPALPIEAAERIAALMTDAGLQAKISSIHVNGWFGHYDKLGMTRVLFRERLGIELDSGQATAAFIGDSPNDAPMFAFFSNSVGVANVRRFAGHMEALPRFVTGAASADGFCEFANHLLQNAGR